MDLPGKERAQSHGEEMANSISHGLGLVGAIVVFPFLVATACQHGSAITVAGAAVFGLSIMLLYGASTLYHALPHGRTQAKKFLRLCDHVSIYILIAGTYTPFTLGVLHGWLGGTLFVLIWGLAIFGVTLKCSGKMWHPRLSTGLYLLMGWLVMIAIVPLYRELSPAGLACLVAGGLAYTGGVYFYVAKHRPYAHCIWHLFVLTGTGCHVSAVLLMQAGMKS